MTQRRKEIGLPDAIKRVKNPASRIDHPQFLTAPRDPNQIFFNTR